MSKRYEVLNSPRSGVFRCAACDKTWDDPRYLMSQSNGGTVIRPSHESFLLSPLLFPIHFPSWWARPVGQDFFAVKARTTRRQPTGTASPPSPGCRLGFYASASRRLTI